MYKLLLKLFLLLWITTQVFAGSSGKISGRVIDRETGEGLPFANVAIKGTTLGAATDIEGYYTILNIPPGVYEVTASIIGYQKQTVTDVRVNVDFTTRLDFEISQGSIDLPAVIVQGERNPLIRQDLTNPTVAITAETITELPVDEISDIIRLQAGVVVGDDGDLHFRGGYGNEVSYTLNGVSINDPLRNSSSLGLATNAVQEVSVSTGTFSAEFGNALSGVVNYVTKEGSEKYSGSLKAYAGDYLSNRTELFENIDEIDPINRSRIEATLGGPIPFLGGAKFFFSGVFEDFKGSLYGNRLYNTTDSYIYRNQFPSASELYGSATQPLFFNPFNTDSTGLPTGDGEIVALNKSRSLNLQGNIIYNFSSLLKAKYEVVYDYSNFDGGGSFSTFESKYMPDSRGETNTTGFHNAIELTHTVNQYFFYTLKASYTVNDGEYYQYEDINDPRYLPSLYQKTLPNMSFLTGGTDNSRYYRQTKAMGIKGDLVAQLWNSHEIKFGFEGRFFELEVESYEIEFGKYDATAVDNFGSLNVEDLLNPNTQIIRRIPSSPSLYSYYMRKPSSFAVYFRDKIELASSLILNAGIRYEYFNPNALYNPNVSDELQNDKQGFIDNSAVFADVKHMVSPRISVSYPITDQGIIRFSYGHFYQNGSLSTIYRNPQFYVANFGTNPTFGNANVDPQKSIQYEMGLLQGLTDDIRLELTAYYKDVSDYIYTQTLTTETGRNLYLLTNLAYTNVKGITLSLFKRRAAESLFQGSLDYTFQIAEGNRTEPQEELFFSDVSNKLSESYLVPLGFDRQHIITGTLNLVQPDNWTLGLVGYFQTGNPYTPAAFPEDEVTFYTQNSSNKPSQWNVDLKFEKFFELGGLDYSIFVHVNNLFDTEREVSVYSLSGRALYNPTVVLSPEAFNDIRNRISRGDEGLISMEQVDNYYSQRPQNVGSPREVRIGFQVIF